MWRELQHNIAKSLHFPIDPKGDFRVQHMLSEISRRGGTLHFDIKEDGDGWLAECTTIPGIITGGTEPNISNEEMNNRLKDAVFSAFGIPPFLADDSLLVGALDPSTRLAYVGR